MTQFAMVEELASLVKDNLGSKHLVLSMEEAFINFLQDHATGSDAVLELEPMDPYNRLLLHRLADIFGFAHVSIGEGDNRHLILERCPETSIPSILVGDILFQHEEPQLVTTSHHLLRRDETTPVLQAKSRYCHTFEEREAAYLAARERIFSLGVADEREPAKRKPRTVPVVACRMIAHALGQKTSPQNQHIFARDCNGYELQTKCLNVHDKIDSNSGVGSLQESVSLPGKNSNSFGKATGHNHYCGASVHLRNFPCEPAGKNCDAHSSHSGAHRSGSKKERSKEEHVGAAKRLFAHALGLHSARDGVLAKSSETKQPGE